MISEWGFHDDWEFVKHRSCITKVTIKWIIRISPIWRLWPNLKAHTFATNHHILRIFQSILSSPKNVEMLNKTLKYHRMFCLYSNYYCIFHSVYSILYFSEQGARAGLTKHLWVVSTGHLVSGQTFWPEGAAFGTTLSRCLWLGTQYTVYKLLLTC